MDVNAVDIASTAMSCVYFGISTIGIVLNGICLVALIKLLFRSTVVNRNYGFVLLSLLCVADILNAVAVAQSGIFRLLGIYAPVGISQMCCFLMLLPTMISATLPNTTMLAITLERLLMVAFPLVSQRHSLLIVKASIAFTLSVAIATTLAAAVNVRSDVVVTVCVTTSVTSAAWAQWNSALGRMLPCGIACGAWLLLVIMFRKRKQTRVSDPATLDSQAKEIRRKQNAVTKTAVIICAIYLITTIGGSLIYAVIAPALQHGTVVYIVTLQMSGVLTNLGSLLNAVVLLWRNGDIRKAVITWATPSQANSQTH